MTKPSISERLAYLSGRLDGLSGTDRYAVDIGMAGELQDIARELMQMSRQVK